MRLQAPRWVLSSAAGVHCPLCGSPVGTSHPKTPLQEGILSPSLVNAVSFIDSIPVKQAGTERMHEKGPATHHKGKRKSLYTHKTSNARS